MRIREQEQSKACWEVLTSRFGASVGWAANAECGRYLAATKKTASRIYVSGLGAAIAFLRSRKMTERQVHNSRLADDLAALTLSGMGPAGQTIQLPVADGRSLDLMDCVRQSSDVATVAWATEEALAACTWLMRYLEGAGVTASEEDDGSGEDHA